MQITQGPCQWRPCRLSARQRWSEASLICLAWSRTKMDFHKNATDKTMGMREKETLKKKVLCTISEINWFWNNDIANCMGHFHGGGGGGGAQHILPELLLKLERKEK